MGPSRINDVEIDGGKVSRAAVVFCCEYVNLFQSMVIIILTHTSFTSALAGGEGARRPRRTLQIPGAKWLCINLR